MSPLNVLVALSVRKDSSSAVALSVRKDSSSAVSRYISALHISGHQYDELCKIQLESQSKTALYRYM